MLCITKWKYSTNDASFGSAFQSSRPNCVSMQLRKARALKAINSIHTVHKKCMVNFYNQFFSLFTLSYFVTFAFINVEAWNLILDDPLVQYIKPQNHENTSIYTVSCTACLKIVCINFMILGKYASLRRNGKVLLVFCTCLALCAHLVIVANNGFGINEINETIVCIIF